MLPWLLDPRVIVVLGTSVGTKGGLVCVEEKGCWCCLFGCSLYVCGGRD